MVSSGVDSQPAPQTVPNHWLSTKQVADLLGYSRSNVKLLVQHKKLHPSSDVRGDWRFDPAEVHAFGNGRREKRKAREESVTGRIAARVFRLLDKLADEDRLDKAKRIIVQRVKIDPSEAQRLFEEWLLPFDEAMKKQQAYEEQARRERAEERRIAREATLERARLEAARTGAKADAAMFDSLKRTGRRPKGDDTP